jgi:hypothetical protein
MNVALCGVAGVVFLKFWIRARDRLLLLFAIAFWILAVDWTVLAIVRHYAADPSEHSIMVYSMRLVAFILILAGIIVKNRPRRSGN